MSAEVASSLRDLLDKQELYENLMRCCRSVDRLDADLIASTLHCDRRVSTGIVEASGPAAGQQLLDIRRGLSVSASHFVGSVLIELESADLAFCEADINSLVVIEKDGRRLVRVHGSRYVDRVERRDGAWKVALRREVDDWSPYDEVERETPHSGSLLGHRDHEDAVSKIRTETMTPAGGDS